MLSKKTNFFDTTAGRRRHSLMLRLSCSYYCWLAPLMPIVFAPPARARGRKADLKTLPSAVRCSSSGSHARRRLKAKYPPAKLTRTSKVSVHSHTHLHNSQAYFLKKEQLTKTAARSGSRSGTCSRAHDHALVSLRFLLSCTCTHPREQTRLFILHLVRARPLANKPLFFTT